MISFRRNVENELDSMIPTVSQRGAEFSAIDQQQNIPFRIFTGNNEVYVRRRRFPLERSHFISEDIIIARTQTRNWNIC